MILARGGVSFGYSLHLAEGKPIFTVTSGSKRSQLTATESVLGREIDPIIKRFLTNTPQRFGVATERIYLQGAVVEIDETTGRSQSITRISERLPDASP